MSLFHDDEAAEDKNLCHQCVGEQYWSELIRRDGEVNNCSYCGDCAPSISLSDAADVIETAFDQHYIRTSDHPTHWQESLIRDRESDYEWYREGECTADAIANAALIEEQIACDIQELLAERHSDFESDQMGEETPFSGDACYEEKPASGSRWQEEWESFEHSLKTEARFFSRMALTHLASIFSEIDKLATTTGLPAIINAGPNTEVRSIYRARVFQSDAELKDALCRPDLHLGPPPPSYANAGRMNAQGIAVFYGTFVQQTAISEVRPPVGSQVAIGEFQIIRSIRLLNLPALNSAHERGSIFDTDLVRRMERAEFLRSLTQRLTRPVMPNDEALSYLATQAVADFLATDTGLMLDGIVFPSVQAANEDSLNVVLFHKAARVEEIPCPQGIQRGASTGEMFEEGWEAGYKVFESVPPPSGEPKSAEGNFEHIGWWESKTDNDTRPPTLRIVVNNMEIHQVQRVRFETIAFQVQSFSYVRTEERF